MSDAYACVTCSYQQGIGARLFMIGTLTAGQFMIYDDIKRALGAKGGAEIQKVAK